MRNSSNSMFNVVHFSACLRMAGRSLPDMSTLNSTA